MSILIKRMSMPISCEYCPLLVERDGEAFCGASKKQFSDVPEYGRMTDCPLVEVEEHKAFSNFDDKERTVYVSVN